MKLSLLIPVTFLLTMAAPGACYLVMHALTEWRRIARRRYSHVAWGSALATWVAIAAGLVMTPHAAAAPQTGLVVPAVPAWLTRAAVTDAYSVAEGLYNAGHTTPDAVARLIANAAHIASQVAWDQMRIVPTDPNHGPYVDAFVAAFRRRLEALAQSTPPSRFSERGIHEVFQRIAVTEQEKPAINALFAFVFPAAVNAEWGRQQEIEAYNRRIAQMEEQELQQRQQREEAQRSCPKRGLLKWDTISHRPSEVRRSLASSLQPG